MVFYLLLCLEGRHPGVSALLSKFRLVFCCCHLRTCEASFSKIDTDVLVLLLSFAPGPPASLLYSLCCDLNFEHTWDLQFPGSLSHGIDFISQNRNRLMSLWRKKIFGQFGTIIKSTNSHAPDPQLTKGRPVLLLLLSEQYIFNCVTLITQWSHI